VVISAQNTQEIQGDELLRYVTKHFPSAVRILVNDPLVSDTISTDETVDVHYRFNQPLNPEEILSTIERFAENKTAITKEAIIKTVAKVKTLPSPPKVYLQLNALLKTASNDVKKITEIIARDPALSAKVLQFANSARLNTGKPLTNIPTAITKMGVDALCCLVMTAELFSYDPKIPGFSLEKEQLHSLSTAKLAASMVKPELKQEAMLAGLLHNIGTLIMFEISPKRTKIFIKHRDATTNHLKLERKVFGVDHSHIGGYLLHLWSFPYSLIEAVILHHSPEKLRRKTFGIAQAVYTADRLLRKEDISKRFSKHYKLDSVLEALEKRAAKFKL